MIFEAAVALLILIGAVFTFIGSLGILRLPDFFTRLHGPTKATTLGVGSTLLGSMVYFTGATGEFSIHEVLITLFLMMTAPLSAHMLAKAGLHHRLPSIAVPPEKVPSEEQRPVDPGPNE